MRNWCQYHVPLNTNSFTLCKYSFSCNESHGLQVSKEQHNNQPDLASESAPPSSLSALTETGSEVNTSQVEMPVSNPTLTMDSHQQVPDRFYSDTFHNAMSAKEEGHTSFDRDKGRSRLVVDSVSETTCAERNPISTNHVLHVPATPTFGSTGPGLKCECDCDSGSSTSRSDQPICILCDEPATVRLLPCGHQIICLMCSKRAKKCLECKVIIRFISWWQIDLVHSLYSTGYCYCPS